MDTVSTSKLCCLLTFEGKEGRMKKEEEEFALVFHGGVEIWTVATDADL